VSERTIYRDLSGLTAQGAPIKGEAGVGYVLGAGLFLPPLALTEEETEAMGLPRFRGVLRACVQAIGSDGMVCSRGGIRTGAEQERLNAKNANER
jgi:hypothetical protein